MTIGRVSDQGQVASTLSNDELVFHGAALGTALSEDPQFQALHEAIKAPTDDFREAASAHRKTSEQTAKATVRRQRALYEAEAALRLALHDCKHQELASGDARLSTSIGDKLDLFRAMSVEDQLKRLDDAAKLVEQLSDHEDHIASLRNASEVLVREDENATKALEAEALALARLTVARSEWLRRYRAVVESLLLKVGDREKVRSYLLPGSAALTTRGGPLGFGPI